MGKRIHKRPGSAAERKALRKSAKRMARDTLRRPDREIGPVLERFFENKSQAQAEMFLKENLLNKARRRVKARAIALEEEINQLVEQNRRLKHGLARTQAWLRQKRQLGLPTLKDLRRTKTAAQVVLENSKLVVEKLEEGKRHVPKDESAGIDAAIRECKKEIIALKKGIRQLDQMMAKTKE